MATTIVHTRHLSRAFRRLLLCQAVLVILASSALLPVFTTTCLGNPGDAEAPNLVFILVDDLGWTDLACYGSDLHETPHLDQLAGEGVRFTHAYSASPVCTPTRASLLTGKHPARLHMTIWREASAERGKRELLEPVTRGDLPWEETTLAEILQQAGYYTAHVGKWHLGSAEYYPQAHGFAENVGGTLWGAPQSFFYPFRGDQYFSDWRYVPDLEPSQEGDYLTDRLTDKALEIIDRMGERPFYLNLWYHTVHTPIEGKPDLVAKYRAKLAADGNHVNPDYAAMVASLDENVGRVLRKLEERGLADRTLVVFFSDNGGFVNISRLQGIPATNNAPLRSGKGSLYEGGIRVPCIVRWPGVTARGATCDALISSCDLLPTLLHALGIDAAVPPQLDGVDVSALFRSPETPLPRDTLYFHYPHYYPTTTPVSAVRERDWKLLEFYEQEKIELYNLATDIGEQRNLVAQHPDVVRRLRAKLKAWQKHVDAQHPTRRSEEN